MKLNDLSIEDQELVLAFMEIARLECAGRTWSEIEPVLSSIWSDRHRGASEASWPAIAPHIRNLCDQSGRL